MGGPRAGVHRIVVPSPAGDPPRNAWLLLAPRVCLVDPGPDTPAAYGAVRDALTLRHLGLRDIHTIVVSHGHGGHAALATRLHAEAGAPVVAHPAALDALAAPAEHVAARFDTARRAARAAGVPAALADGALGAWRATLEAEIGAAPLALPRSAGRPAADGDPVPLGPTDAAAWTVRWTGGHAVDHVALVDETIGLAATGDLIARDHATAAALLPSRADGRRAPQLDALRSSWRRLARLPLSTWLPGHGPTVRAPRVLVARRLAALRTALLAARHALDDAPITAWRLAERIGLARGDIDARRSLVAIVGVVDWLVDRGLCARDVQGGVWQLRRGQRRVSGRPRSGGRDRPARR